MCNRYVAPAAGDIERFWSLRPSEVEWWKQGVFPRSQGPFIRGRLDAAGAGRELVVGQWGLVPFFAKSAKLSYSTNNARSEEMAAKATYKLSWRDGRRCIIPALSFDEPCWETGKNVWWTFRRRDAGLWGLAGLWNTWVDKTSGEIVESYTMLTINADSHPLMSRMHKPDPSLPADQQDKRSVVSIELADVDRWLFGSVEEASALIASPPAEIIEAEPLLA